MNDTLKPVAVSYGGAPRTLALLTCSMAKDIDLFEVLAKSVDRYVDPSIVHRVVVPRSDLAAFQRFATPRREILAQEDILPMRLRSVSPIVLRLVSLLTKSKRPLYLAPGLRPVRGWILQQLLKLELSRTAEETAVMHVDSDVFFIRPIDAQVAFDQNRTRFFRVEGGNDNPMHSPWISTAQTLLGLSGSANQHAHYIENCVLWDSSVVRKMIEKIENNAQKPLHKVICASSTLSEYYLYGLYADHFTTSDDLARMDTSVCKSYWTPNPDDQMTAAAITASLGPEHYAVAIQSTYGLDNSVRKTLSEQLGTPAA